MRRALVTVFALHAGACSSPGKQPIPERVQNSVAFTYKAGNFITVPVQIGDSEFGNFILDTGAGLNLISTDLCKKLNCQLHGVTVGKRMSGQEIKVPFTTVSSIAIAGRRIADVTAGVFDIAQVMPGLNVDGFLSLEFFKKTPFTIDCKSLRIKLESDSDLAAIRKTGVVVPIRIHRIDRSLDVFVPLELPDHKVLSMEVDTGSQALILHEKYMKSAGIKRSELNAKKGTDETGHAFTRYFGQIRGNVRLPGEPQISQDNPDVMFQNIIYDGLVGQFFLRDFVVTFDLPKSEMIFRAAD